MPRETYENQWRACHSASEEADFGCVFDDEQPADDADDDKTLGKQTIKKVGEATEEIVDGGINIGLDSAKAAVKTQGAILKNAVQAPLISLKATGAAVTEVVEAIRDNRPIKPGKVIGKAVVAGVETAVELGEELVNSVNEIADDLKDTIEKARKRLFKVFGD